MQCLQIKLFVHEGGYVHLNTKLLNRLLVSRHLYSMAVKSLGGKTEIHLHTTISLLQDSVEIFLLALAYHLDANIKETTGFGQYLIEIDKKLTSYELPFKAQVLRLNKVRVLSKHYCTLPQRSDCEEFIYLIKGFFSDVTDKVFNLDFESISLIDAIEDSSSKVFLEEAKNALLNLDYVECAISCRKAIYLEFEKKYDISHFIDQIEDKKQSFNKFLSPAPSYAKNHEYIVKSVKQPTDFIVLDHEKLDRELEKYSIEKNMYWNVWRLTPEIYQYANGNWAIKNDFDILDNEILTENINYIFNSTVEIILRIQDYNREIKSKTRRFYTAVLKGNDIPVYRKADNNSDILILLPNDIKEVDTTYSVKGLKDDAVYWKVVIIMGEEEYYDGYINSENIE